jgi:hypothetical protein
MRILLIILDAVIVTLAGVAWYVATGGGFVLHLSDLAVRFRSPARPLLWLTLALIIRYAVYRRSAPFGWADWRRFLLGPDGADPFQLQAVPGYWRRVLFASLGIAGALAILMFPVVRHPYSVPDYADPLFSIWRMAWVQHQLLTDPSHLFDANIFYPEPLTLTFSDPIILPALMQAPLTAIGVPPAVSYNVLFLIAIWASGVATYLLVERLTRSPWSGFIAGLIYACYPYRFEHISHLELQMTQWMPLGLLALHLFVSTGRPAYAFALAMAVVAQLYSSMYYAVFFVVFASAVGLGLVLTQRPPIRRMVLPLAAAALAAAVVAAPLARAFVRAQPVKGDRDVDEIKFYSATFSDYMRPQPFSVWWKDVLPKAEQERALFPGAAPLTLAAIGLVPPLGAIRMVYAAALLISLDASRGFNGVIYPHLHRWVPGVRGLRVSGRFSILVGLALAIHAGFGVRRLLACIRRPAGRRVLFLVLAAGVVVDAYSRFSVFVPVWAAPPAIYEHIKGKPGVVLAEVPVTDMPYVNTVYMYFSLWHWAPMVNGYSGFLPQWFYEQLFPRLGEFPRGNSADVLREHGVTHVTVNCGLRYMNMNCEETADLMRISTDLRLIAETRWEGAPVRLYELIRR